FSLRSSHILLIVPSGLSAVHFLLSFRLFFKWMVPISAEFFLLALPISMFI
ncbi:hypothetical protein L9F63_010590, partial [Diploptera punctata]